MRSFWTDRRLVAVPAVVFLFGFSSAFAQRGGGAASAGSGNTGSVSRGNTSGNSSTGGLPSNNPSTLTRPMFLSGKVIFDDGSPANQDIKIERICGGSIRLEAHTDNKGRFSFQVGQSPLALSDVSESPGGGPFGSSIGSPGNSSVGNGSLGTSMSKLDPLWDCELRAQYPGFRSDLIDLSTRHSLDDPDVGTIVLHRLANVKGSTISLTTELAPKHAQKAYEKGMQAEQKGKSEEAEKDFAQATELYPKYAIAWFALGELQELQGNKDSARKSYLAAASADDKYLSPYDRLGYLSANENNWQDAANYSKHVIDLNPIEFPSAFWCNALANYQMHKLEEAEKSLAELLKLDTRHRYPDAENMMAELLLARGKDQEAAVHLRAYLALVPNAKNADALKAILLKIDQASAQTKPQ